MADPDMPAPVARAIDAVNAGETDAFLGGFADDGFNGYSRFVFAVGEDGLLRSMTIVA